MIDWHHPRVYERLRCFGLTLFTLGVASHNEGNPPVAIAAILVATLLVVRLRIELGIGRDEERCSLERKLRRIDLINALVVVPAALVALALLPRLSGLGMFFDPTSSGVREPQ
jgi:multisubunit Na+/H+ antiporter MnhB subunit